MDIYSRAVLIYDRRHKDGVAIEVLGIDAKSLGVL